MLSVVFCCMLLSFVINVICCCCCCCCNYILFIASAVGTVLAIVVAVAPVFVLAVPMRMVTGATATTIASTVPTALAMKSI
jgi:hypothetical protein